jgi:tyrosine aminotransferase
MMIGLDMKNFPDFSNELDFVSHLVKEQSVFCLPGKCFDVDNFIRIVLTVPDEMIAEACERIKEFCTKYYKPSKTVNIEELTNNFIKSLEE